MAYVGQVWPWLLISNVEVTVMCCGVAN